jgi:hypothetical protein
MSTDFCYENWVENQVKNKVTIWEPPNISPNKGKQKKIEENIGQK